MKNLVSGVLIVTGVLILAGIESSGASILEQLVRAALGGLALLGGLDLRSRGPHE